MKNTNINLTPGIDTQRRRDMCCNMEDDMCLKKIRVHHDNTCFDCTRPLNHRGMCVAHGCENSLSNLHGHRVVAIGKGVRE